MRFRTTLDLGGKTTTGFRVPADVVARLGRGKRPPVRVTINGYRYRTTVAVMGGDFVLGVSSEHRGAAGVAYGDVVEIDLELDTEPREVAVPDDLRAALDADEAAARFFEGLSYSNRLRHVLPINDAKTPETRERRIAKSVGMFREGRA